MNRKFALIGTAVLLMSGSGAWADGETTIRLMGVPNAELPGEVTKEISLPYTLIEDLAAVEKAMAVEKSAGGLDTANRNRMTNREDGLSTADAARESAAEMVDAAAESRQNNERGERPERPDPAGPPGGA